MRPSAILLSLLLAGCVHPGQPGNAVPAATAGQLSPLQKIDQTEEHLAEPLIYLCDGLFSGFSLVQITPTALSIFVVQNRQIPQTLPAPAKK